MNRHRSRAEPERGAPGALVVGGDYRALGIVRSLGRHGVPVWVLRAEHSLAAMSRYSKRSLPWPQTAEEEQVAYLAGLSRDHGLQDWALFPTGDETAALVARHHAELSEHYRLTTPSWTSTQLAHDKRLMYALATEVGVDRPWTYSPANAGDLATLDCPFPVILKPAFREGFNPFVRAKAWRVDDQDELLARYDQACKLVAPEIIMVQEFIPGHGESQFAFGALCSEGHPVASVTVRRTRQYPLDFGLSSSFVETVDLPEVEGQSRRVLAAMAYSGLVEVEFKRDPRDGRYKVLDINPRVWGWHTVGRRAGVDFPYLAWQMTQGLSVPEIRGRADVRWIRMVTDLPAVFHQLRRGQLSLASYLWSLRWPLEWAVFATDDPLPGLLEVPEAAYAAWNRHRMAERENSRQGPPASQMPAPVGYGGLAQRAKAKPWEKVDGQATGKPLPCWTEHPAVPPLRDTKG